MIPEGSGRGEGWTVGMTAGGGIHPKAGGGVRRGHHDRAGAGGRHLLWSAEGGPPVAGLPFNAAPQSICSSHSHTIQPLSMLCNTLWSATTGVQLVTVVLQSGITRRPRLSRRKCLATVQAPLFHGTPVGRCEAHMEKRASKRARACCRASGRTSTATGRASTPWCTRSQRWVTHNPACVGYV